jgi:hypothetical protein
MSTRLTNNRAKVKMVPTLSLTQKQLTDPRAAMVTKKNMDKPSTNALITQVAAERRNSLATSRIPALARALRDMASSRASNLRPLTVGATNAPKRRSMSAPGDSGSPRAALRVSVNLASTTLQRRSEYTTFFGFRRNN